MINIESQVLITVYKHEINIFEDQFLDPADGS